MQPEQPRGSAAFDDVMAALSRLLDLQTQHGQVEGAIEFLTGLTAERVEALGGVPDATSSCASARTSQGPQR